MSERTCAMCDQSSGTLKYCSGRCRSKSKNSKYYKRPERYCPGCGLNLSDRHGQVKYCSNTCRRWVANGHTELRQPAQQCIQCGGAMIGKMATAIYCTKRCKLAASDGRRTRDDRARYLKERERRIEYALQYAQDNPHIGQAAKRKRKALLAEAGVFELSGRDWLRLVNRHGRRCFYCGTCGPMTMDHVLPISRGGHHSIGNLVPACAQCNSTKRHRTIMEWRLGKRVSLAA
jgi:5-methylcytosine-specific restriction endonuclease McrA